MGLVFASEHGWVTQTAIVGRHVYLGSYTTRLAYRGSFLHLCPHSYVLLNS